jgi:hypothetical protein
MSNAPYRSPFDDAGETDTSPWGTLRELVACAVRSEHLARELMSSALAESGLPAAPQSKRDVLQFAKTHLLTALAAAVGEYSAFSLTDSFAAKLTECEDGTPGAPPVTTSASPGAATPPPQSAFRKRLPSISGMGGRPLALIALSDPFERAWLARTLVSEGLDVRSNETIHELLEILRDPETLSLAVVDVERRDLLPVLRSIVALRPTLPLIACTKDVPSAILLLEATGLRLLHLHAQTSPRRELVDAILRHASEGAVSTA